MNDFSKHIDGYTLEIPIVTHSSTPQVERDIHALMAESKQSEQNNDLEAALSFGHNAWNIFINSNAKTDELHADLLQHLTQIYRRQQNFHKLEEFSRPLLDITRRLHDEKREAWALLNLGIVRSVESDYRAAMTLFVESLEKSEKTGFRVNTAHCLINIGNVYANLFNYEDAFDRYQIALTDYADVLKSNTLIAAYLNLGNLCYSTEQNALAFQYYHKGLEIAVENADNDMTAHAYTLICRSFLYEKKWEEARQYVVLGKNIGVGKQINALNIAEMSFLDGDTEGGIRQALTGIAVARRVKDDVSELRGFKFLAEIYEKNDNYKSALRAQNIYSTKQADYLKMQRSMHALDLEIRFSLREKQRKIEELTKENSFQALLLEKSDYIEQQNTQLKQANEELQQFAYITSHDLKEPLRMIGSFSQIIEQQYHDKFGKDTMKHFKFIKDGVNRMNALLDALLQYATIGKIDIELEPVDINEIVNISRQNLQLKINETSANVLCGAMPTILSVSSLLNQLFQNLMGNALKFAQPNSRPIILINAEMRRDYWLFSVEDNGIGIDKEHQERIFVIFQRLHTQARYEGTGIGLAICHKIVTQLGGRIWVESQPNQGATFFFTLPK